MMSPNTAAQADKPSYWDEPPEKQLEGKTLSKLDLSELAHVEEHTHHKTIAPPEKQPGSYWDDPAEAQLEGKTLSKLDLAELGHVGEHTHHLELQGDAPPPPTKAAPNMEHKGRSTWKDGYRKMSNNTLMKMDEGHADKKNTAMPVGETPSEEFIMSAEDGF